MSSTSCLAKNVHVVLPTSLRSLHIHLGASNLGKLAMQVERLPCLTELILPGTDEKHRRIVSHHASSLTSLHFTSEGCSYSPYEYTMDFSPFLPERTGRITIPFPQLRSLTVANGTWHLALETSSSLTSLTMLNTRLPYYDTTELACFPNVTHLSLTLAADDHNFELLHRFPALRDLTLRNYTVANATPCAVVSLLTDLGWPQL